MTTIYHGSSITVSQPDFAKCKPHNDYGLGFYCTYDKDLASEWACPSNSEDGVVNAYQIDMSDLTTVNLDAAPNGVLTWAATLMQNRPVNFFSHTDLQAIATFIEKYSLDPSKADVVEGYRADDSYFDIMRAFAINTITVEHLEKALRLGNLGRQVVLKSTRALQRLSFLGSEHVDARIWGPRRDNRNRKAKAQFIESRSAKPTDGTYLIDILRTL